MYVRKSDVANYGRTPGCRGRRDVVIEKPLIAKTDERGWNDYCPGLTPADDAQKHPRTDG